MQMGFEVPIEIFGRIPCGRVGRQIEAFDPFRVFADPLGHSLGMVGCQIVQDQKNFPWAVCGSTGP